MPDHDERIAALEREMTAIQTEVRIQFKDLFNRIKRVENTILAASGAICAMLLAVLLQIS
tara:strand:+ start:315 stop:494 length:180 start_codon:yes stop_codon:yes gene_type:complete